jgi:hypothetical protein
MLTVKVPIFEFVLNKINNYLLIHLGNGQKYFGDLIWSTIDGVITIAVSLILKKESEIYVFTPDQDCLDDDEGNLWSFYYFFYNKNEKRVLFFNCRAVRYESI